MVLPRKILGPLSPKQIAKRQWRGETVPAMDMEVNSWEDNFDITKVDLVVNLWSLPYWFQPSFTSSATWTWGTLFNLANYRNLQLKSHLLVLSINIYVFEDSSAVHLSGGGGAEAVWGLLSAHENLFEKYTNIATLSIIEELCKKEVVYYPIELPYDRLKLGVLKPGILVTVFYILVVNEWHEH